MKLQLLNYIDIRIQEFSLKEFDDYLDLNCEYNYILGMLVMLYECMIIKQDEYLQLYNTLYYIYVKRVEEFEK